MLSGAGVQVYVKRDDLIHPEISGNKWRKLKYNLMDAHQQRYESLLTFGGAYSNHLYAVAAAGSKLGFRTIGIVRGEERADLLTSTLQFCKDRGMHLHRVSRTEYRQRHDDAYQRSLAERFGNPYLIPEGGTTTLALKGHRELVAEIGAQLHTMPDYFAVAAGTGGTAAGILSAGANVLAFSALKGANFLRDDIDNLLVADEGRGELTLFNDYHFGGYARWDESLVGFIRDFRLKHAIQLEQVYTAKMFYGLFDQIKKGYFASGTTIVAVHTGGLQGLLSILR
jgi:1-aminocyclopropane-1-carboxylate deaminase